MAGLSRLLICIFFAAHAALAEPATPAPASTAEGTPRPGMDRRKAKAAMLSAEFADVRKAMDALTPEQRQRFVENFRRWANLSQDEKKALTDREGFRRRRMQEEVAIALADSGLALEGERRVQFAKRYVAERRKIEEQLRQETEQKRKPLMEEVSARLKAEFAAGAANTPAPTPASQP